MSGFSKPVKNASKALFGPEVERVEVNLVVTDSKGVEDRPNLKLDFESGAVWMKVGHLNTTGEPDVLQKDNGTTIEVEKLAIIEQSSTEFEIDERHTPRKSMHGKFKLWRGPKGVVVQLIRVVGGAEAPKAKSVTVSRKAD